MRLYSTTTMASGNINQTPPLLIMNMYKRSAPNKNLNPSPNPSPIQNPNPPSATTKKVKWGEPTWFLFHTLSVKIKDSEFANIRQELLNNTYSICCNLPCPDCANHAKIYLDGINFNTIQTKEDYKKMMFQFHNSVNKRKGYPQFNYSDLDAKYSMAITKNIIQNFMVHFQDRNRSIKLIASDLHRAQMSIVLKKWFNTVIDSFDP
jgi:Erv1 / Alr family